MKSFRRSLTYLWPYRLRIGVAVVCVLVIATLWASGLGLLFPGAKILISDEGLHGWVFKVVADKRLGISSLQSTVRVPGAAPQVAVQMVHVEDGKPAARAGLKTRQWIVGLAAKAGASPPTAASAAPGETNLARTIAFAPTDQPVVLGIYDQLTQQVTSVQVTLPPPPAAYGA
ncbi:MAG: hypothetical protein MUP47_10945, partial [Phycisphaerae bacterium]|nr:hypothetical protein [Phycisphaerae bacterium]